MDDFLRGLFPDASNELVQLFAGAAENADLLQTDFFTIRDLLDLSGYAKSETLAVLLLCLLLALEEGSLCVEASGAGITRRLSGLVDEARAAEWAGKILADLRDNGFPVLIGRDGTDNKPIIWKAGKEKAFFYFQKYLFHEQVFQEALAARLRSPLPAEPDGLAGVLREVLVEKPLILDGKPLTLDDRQLQALAMALVRNFVIISGGPGTGKTSIVLTLLRCLLRCGLTPERIALAAPTGRAAQRLGDALRLGLQNLPAAEEADNRVGDLTAHTLHHLLNYRPERAAFGRHAENPVPADVVIVDEVSMVGVVLMSRLFQALTPGTRLILLGDKDQLPSVEAGGMLANLVTRTGPYGCSPALAEQIHRLFPGLKPPSGTGPLGDVLAILEENYRSEPNIRKVARGINQQETTIIDRLPAIESESANGKPSFPDLGKKTGCWFWPLETVSQLHGALEHWADQQYRRPAGSLPSFLDLVGRCGGIRFSSELAKEEIETLEQLFQVMNRGRLLTLVREGPWGCGDINRFLEQKLRGRQDRAGLFPGALVLVTRNDHARQLFNGDVGVALRSPGGGIQVAFPRQGGYHAFPADSLPAHELGFAVTVHKSQGSEYTQVLLILPPSAGRRLLTKELIYTAVTRAKQLALLGGTRETLRFAVGRCLERESGLVVGER